MTCVRQRCAFQTSAYKNFCVHYKYYSKISSRELRVMWQTRVIGIHNLAGCTVLTGEIFTIPSIPDSSGVFDAEWAGQDHYEPKKGKCQTARPLE
jgi:hypothetical protein